MLRFLWAQLRGRPRRTLALLAGVLVATTGFTVLSASAATQQLRINGAVDANYRPAYDILVRPKGSRTALEDGRGLVRPNYLSGLFGGITMAQLDQVRATRHVELAAPIAMLGYARVYLEQVVDLTDQLDPTARAQLFRLTPSWIADRGLTVLNDAPQYVYVTRNRLISQELGPGGGDRNTYTDGTVLPSRLTDCYTVLEVREDGGKAELCLSPNRPGGDGTSTHDRTILHARQITPEGRFADVHPIPQSAPRDRLTIGVGWDVLVLAAAIDPAAEAGLVDLDKAVLSGRYLTDADKAVPYSEAVNDKGWTRSWLGVPALIASSPYVDEQVQVAVAELGPESTAAVADRSRGEWVPALAAAPGTSSGAPSRSTDAPRFADKPDPAVWLPFMYQAGSPEYQADASGVLRPRPVALPPELWQVPIGNGQATAYQPPMYALDHGFRPLTRVGQIGGDQPGTRRVGVFDPARLRGFSPLSRVPLETYQAPEAVGADERTRELLAQQTLRPNSNPAGYLATPPLVLTNLGSLEDIPMRDGQRAAPLSAIRVRLAGVGGFDPQSRELVRAVGEDIAAATGLDVDITIGSSPEPQTVVLPAGKGGRPELTLSEGWSRKGVATVIVQAADRKSLLLFGLILLVCALFLGNAVAAAVRDRRRELAVLACLGWPPGRLALTILGEVALVGLVAGGLAAAVAVPLSGVLGVAVPGWHALLALPVGLGLGLLAAAWPAWLAARAKPGAAVHPAVLGVRRVRRRSTILGLALANLRRVPGRTALGVLALAVGIGALTVLVAIAVGFRNDVIGTLLGDAVTLRVRTVDVLAALAAVLLGILAVGDVLYINVRERSAELAALWAGGWTDRALLRLVGYEGLGIGVLGALTGAAAGLGAVAWLVGDLTRDIVWLAVFVAGAAIAVAALAAAVPALLLRRFPLSTLLAEE